MARIDTHDKIVRVKTNNAPSAADLIFMIVAPITAIRGTVKLTQSDGDMAAHIRMGDVILSSGHIPSHSLSSYTASADHMVAHGWLSEVLFALIFRLGGLPLLSVLTAILVGATHGSIALFLRKRGVDPRWAYLAAILSFALGSTHWLTRPHMFSIAGAALTLFLLESSSRKRTFLALPLFAVWANLHGGWLFGLMMIGIYIAGDLAEAFLSRRERSEWIEKAKGNASLLGVGAAATLINPYGWGLHREVLWAVTSSSLAKNIAEFMPPNFQDSGQWPFLIAILATIALFSIATKRIQMPWLFVILMSFFFSLRSFRNIALFGVSAWPLVALYASESIPRPARPFPLFKEFARLDPGSRVGIIAVPITIMMLLLGLNRGVIGGIAVIPDRFSPKAFPTAAIDSARKAGLDGRIFENWAWGGYIMYAWPEARLHVDPLKFNDQTIKSYSMIEDLAPGWKEEVNRWQIQTIIINTKSPMAKRLALEPAWKVWYRDSTAVVFRAAAVPGA